MRQRQSALLASCAAFALAASIAPAEADILVGGAVFPADITTGTTHDFVTVGSFGNGNLTINGGSTVTVDPTNPPTPSAGMNVGSSAGSTGTVTVTGENSVFTFNPNLSGTPSDTTDDVAPALNIGRSGFGSLTVSAGGRLVVNGIADAPSSQTGAIQLGGSSTGANGAGILTVTGAGSTVDTTGSSRFINVGRNGASATGLLEIEDGGTVNASVVNLGRLGASGTLTMSGAGSTLNLSQPVAGFGVGLNIGRDVGSFGSVTISSGAKINIDGSGAPAGGMTVGFNGSGSMTLQNAGTELTITGNQIDPATSLGPGFTVGRNAQGFLNVLDGAKITVTDNSPEGHGGMSIGGNAAQAAQGLPAGDGQVLVSGVGSEIKTVGSNTGVSVGRSGTGSLTVANGGRIETNDLNVGRDAGSTGTLTVNGGTIALSAATPSTTPVGNAGAVFTVGRSGIGTASFSNAAATISGAAGTGLNGLAIGGTRLANVDGTGTVTLDNTAMSISGDTPVVQVGIDTGTGTLTMTNASSLSLGTGGQVVIGSGAGSTGTVTIGGGSTLSVAGPNGFVGVARAIDSAQASGGTGTLILSNGTVQAAETHVYAGGLVGGIGTIAGDLAVHDGGIVAPGSSPGTLHVDGDFTLEEGAKLVIEVQEIGGKIQTDFLDVTGTIDLDGIIEFLLLGDATPDDLLDFQPDDFFSQLVDFSDVDFLGSTADGTPLAIEVTPDGIVATARVPEPATLTLVAFGIAAIGWARRRRR